MIEHSWKRKTAPLPDHPTDQHCLHLAGMGFPVIPQCPQFPNGVVGMPRSCCWCGPVRLHFVGIVEEGHGPWNTYEAGSKLIVAQG